MGSTVEYRDRGWAWVILFSGSLVMGTILCIPHVYSLLFRNMLDSFGSSSTSVSWIFSTFTFCFNLSVIFCAPISSIWGCRVPGVITCFLVSVGMFCSAYATSHHQLLLTFGILSGIGSGMSATLAYLTIASYFHKYRGMAIGVSLASASVARILSPYIINTLLESYPDRGAQLIFSAIILNTCPASMTFRPIPIDSDSEDIPPDEKPSLSPPPSSIRQLWTSVKKSVDLTLLKNPMFIIMLIIDCCGWLVLYNTPMLIPYYVDSLGLEGQGILVLTFIPIFDLLSRIITPSLTDIKYFSVTKLFLVAGVLTSLGLAGIIFARSTATILSASSVYGFGIGAVTTLFGLLLIRFFGIDRLPSSLGLIAVSKAFFTLFAGTLIGYLRDATDTYLGSLAFLDACAVLIVALFCLEPWANKYNSCTHTHTSIPTDDPEKPR